MWARRRPAAVSSPSQGPEVLPLYGEALSPGARVGRFVVEASVHRGEAATLYRAREGGAGPAVAVKVLHAPLTRSPSALRRFAQECETLSALRHPHAVRLLDSGALHDGRPYLAMEWLEGRDLASELEARGPFSLSEARAALAPVAEALDAAHALGLVHRDVKAQNVM
ncbi:MAG TPA: protein kinase, partial [Myxococcaceae bacterium]|nr:protein kinase [Myxococcaceae bacterium]